MRRIVFWHNDVCFKKSYLTMLAIMPEYRGLHLAEKLECEAIKARISQFNASEIQFYKKYGYLILEEVL